MNNIANEVARSTMPTTVNPIIVAAAAIILLIVLITLLKVVFRKTKIKKYLSEKTIDYTVVGLIIYTLCFWVIQPIMTAFSVY